MKQESKSSFKINYVNRLLFIKKYVAIFKKQCDKIKMQRWVDSSEARMWLGNEQVD